MKGNLRDSKKNFFCYNEGKIVSEKLHINLLENMKGRTISDLFDFLK
jgi:hypothetical protein